MQKKELKQDRNKQGNQAREKKTEQRLSSAHPFTLLSSISPHHFLPSCRSASHTRQHQRGRNPESGSPVHVEEHTSNHTPKQKQRKEKQEKEKKPPAKKLHKVEWH